ncbi:hypothetical protein [Natrialbaceae archaeon AArc-T1-2]|uniref:hypothetical protein n=1 Tax=Natrialbaceae archaeon AArc-T1-2 TaxID=3053904 RepID=UPI00255B0E1B|nr:hypothetical protein [Natrialbaceae archaeon AArc-T1-2]WIV66245.1 hypothetical protein QQ977_11140 [Natrialbaceae archaeon AArc-T1-2]
MTGPLDAAADSIARLGRVVAIAVSLAFAFAPLSSIARDVSLVTGVDLVSPAAGVGLLVVAAGLDQYGDRGPSSYFAFAVATVACWSLFGWLSGLSGHRLELAPTMLAAEALVFLAAVTTAVALTFYTDWSLTSDSDPDEGTR